MSLTTIIAFVLPALLTFLLGLYAASYGTRLGKAVDARKEMLADMRDWIDKIQDYVNLMYQNVQGTSELAWTNEDRASLSRYRITSVARWLGISKNLGSKDLFIATQEFVKAEYDFEVAYISEMIKISREDPAFQQKFTKLQILNSQFTNQAEYLHGVITQKTLRGLPKWLFGKSSPIVKTLSPRYNVNPSGG